MLGNIKITKNTEKELTHMPMETNILGNGKKLNTTGTELTLIPTEIDILGNGKMVCATDKEPSRMLVEGLKMVYGKEINYLNQNNKYKTKKTTATTTCIFISQCVVLNFTLLVI